MNLEELYGEYTKADLEIAALKKKQKGIVTDINNNHLEEVHKTSNTVVIINDEAHTLTPVIDRESKNSKEDKDRKIFEFKVEPTKIFKKE